MAKMNRRRVFHEIEANGGYAYVEVHPFSSCKSTEYFQANKMPSPKLDTPKWIKYIRNENEN